MKIQGARPPYPSLPTLLVLYIEFVTLGFFTAHKPHYRLIADIQKSGFDMSC